MIIYVFIMLEGPFAVFAVVALDRIFVSPRVEVEGRRAEGGKVLLRYANVYQIEKDVMYPNLIYVYLVTSERKCLFNRKLIQFGNSQTILEFLLGDEP